MTKRMSAHGSCKLRPRPAVLAMGKSSSVKLTMFCVFALVIAENRRSRTTGKTLADKRSFRRSQLTYSLFSIVNGERTSYSRGKEKFHGHSLFKDGHFDDGTTYRLLRICRTTKATIQLER